MLDRASSPSTMSSTPFNLTNLRDFVVKEGNGVKGLVDTGIATLPEQYIQPPEHRFDAAKVSPQESIPIIDVSNWDDPVVKKSIFDAASKWGFFQIINHGVSEEILESVKDGAHKFFGSPIEERKKYLKGNSPTDTVHLATSFTPHVEKVLEWKDYLSFLYSPEASSLWPPVCRYGYISNRSRFTPHFWLYVLYF